ncbi:MAG: hypothetical protein ACKODX_06345 [Gemmata sp.]
MTLPFILVVCLAGVFCLIPLTFYLLWLAQVTRRDRPTAVSGPWDFAALTVGLSGFILYGGGVTLALLQSNFRFFMRGKFEALRNVWIQEQVTWSLLAFLYLVTVLGGIALALLARRRSLVVYNVESDAFEVLLGEVFEHLGITVERRGNLWAGAGALCEVEPLEVGRTVTLRWLSPDDRLFEDVTRQLRAALAAAHTPENAVTRWLMAVAVGLGAVVVCCFGLLVFWLTQIR